MMKEETQVNTYTDSPCKEFIPHRFKTSHCIHCFKPKSQHVQDESTKAEKLTVQIIEINSNHVVVPENKNKLLHKKSAVRTTSNNNGEKLEDGVLDRSMLAGKTNQLRKQFESQDAIKQQAVNMNHKHTNGAMSSNNEQREHDFVMNIPIKSNIESEIKDLNSNSNHNGAINDHYESDSDSETLSEVVTTRFWSPKKWNPKATRAMDPIPSVISDESSDGKADVENDEDIPVLKSIHPHDKQEIQFTPDGPLPTGSNGLQEFQRIAKLLRHVDPPPESPKLERKLIKRNSPRSASQSSVKNTAPVKRDNVDLHEQEKSNHDRKTVAEPKISAKREETPVTNNNEKVVSDIKAQKTKTTSEIADSSSPTKPNKPPKKSYSPINLSQIDLSIKPVTIKFRDGSVSHYDGSPRPSKRSDKNIIESEQAPVNNSGDQKQQSPSKLKPYVVVDISRDMPKGLSTRDRRSITGPPLPCTPPPRSRPVSQHSSQDGYDEIGRSNSVDSALTDSTESDISPVKRSANALENKMHTDDSKRDTPPFPMLLETEGYEPPVPSSKQRRERKDRDSSSGSSQYKVPIFIQPQNYDNLGTVKSDSETKLDVLSGKTPEDENAPRPPVRSDSQDYLVPMRDSIGSNVSAELDALSPASRDSGSFSASENESKTSNQVVNNYEEFRSRAQSHPQQKPEPVYAKITHDLKKGGGKQKRTAPGPPLCELDEQDGGFPDTLPRSPPPPPPPPPQANKEKLRSSASHVVEMPRQQQATNIYSQAPQRKPAPDVSNKGSAPERPKAINPQGSPEKGLGNNKGQAPRLKAESARQKPAEPSSKLNLDRSVSPPKKFSQSVKAKSPEPPASVLPRSSASVRTKEPSSNKAKAPIPLQIHNALSQRSVSQSPPRSQAPVPKQKQGTGVNQVQSPPVRRSMSPLEVEVPLSPKQVDVQTKSVPSNDQPEASPPTARTISPLPPNSPLLNRRGLQLPDDTITGGPVSSKQPTKKVKLPWKRRNKRKGDGSPEREFNAEPVQKWLDEIQKMQLEDIKGNRHSLERLDVINAYKGQPTATINVGDAKAPSIPMSPLAKPADKDNKDGLVKPRSNSDNSSGPVPKPRKNSDATEPPIPRPRKNSSAKRQAPRPPSGLDDEEKEEDEDDEDYDDGYVHMLQKSYSTSPTHRRKRHGSCGDNGNVYENLGVQRQEEAPPNKPTRRVRNRTTGFEDLPSQERMAPKVPDEEQKTPLCKKQSLSDQDLRKIGSSEETHPIPPPRARRQSDTQAAVVEVTTSSPLKSAMKTKVSEESKKVEEDGRPKRPVRILAPRTANQNSKKQPRTASIFDNLEYLLTSDLKLGEKAGLDSFYGKDESKEEVCNSTVDAAVQCSAPVVNNGMNSVMDAMLVMNRRTLSAFLSSWKEQTAQKEWWSKETNWGELINREEPLWCDEETVFYQAVHKDHRDTPVTVMIPLKTERDNILQVAEFSKSISSHPNLYTAHSATSLNGIGTNSNPDSATIDKRKPSDLPAIVVGKQPVMSLSAFVKENQQYHLEQAEKYEEDVSLVLLQLCSAIQHLQSHHLSMQHIDIKHVHLAQRSSSAHKVVLNHLLSELHCGESEDGEILATQEQIDLRTAEFSLGLLAYELLHCPNPFSTKTSLRSQDYKSSDLPTIPNRSKYSLFLHNLASQFLSKHPSERLTASQGVLALQTMLWGPQMDQLPSHVQDAKDLELALQQWLMLAQASVVSIVAEAAVAHQVIRCKLKDQMKCQFLSQATVATLKEGLTLLYFTTS
ncbi:uncharacterized protein [Amphiura filiformis]|uniref:uncharacterized protein n=1 Tax=Amphiura filiformis TaxID=82378 RepID=UPI003B21C4C2